MRILTSHLLGVLADLLQTTHADSDAGAIGGILLHTARGNHGSEPGALELLAGISTTRRIAGHTYAPCAGQLVAPTLWARRDVRSVVTVFKAARGKDKKNLHAVEIHAGGGEVEIREDPNLIDDGVRLTFGEGDASDFPAPSVYRLLACEFAEEYRDLDGRVVGAQPITHYMSSDLAPFLTVAKRRGELLRLFRSHQFHPQLVQIGEAYRGILAPAIPSTTGYDEQRPDADLFPPDLDHKRWQPAEQPERPAEERRPDQLEFDVDGLIAKLLEGTESAGEAGQEEGQAGPEKPAEQDEGQDADEDGDEGPAGA
ncbi:hypothetical protein ACL02T_33105 [Pseudonocardia sp. RS010]|uniref:hypothetical protein n=1 Tax=Pseudonocardia sp. RS010 TaxID=3385979 RepID=UPI0039A29B00